MIIAARDAEHSTIQQAEWVPVHGRRSFFSPCVIDRARDMMHQTTVFPRWLRKIRALGSPELSIHLGPTSASTRPRHKAASGLATLSYSTSTDRVFACVNVPPVTHTHFLSHISPPTPLRRSTRLPWSGPVHRQLLPDYVRTHRSRGPSTAGEEARQVQQLVA
jgi:hypothetical protein